MLVRLLILLLLPLLAWPVAARAPVASAVDVAAVGGQTSVTVELSAPLKGAPKAFALAQPLRWVVDLPGATSARLDARGAGAVKAARVSQFDAGTARLVIDLDRPMAVIAVTQDARDQLVVLLSPTGDAAFRAQVARGRNPIGGFSFATPAPTPPPAPAPTARVAAARPAPAKQAADAPPASKRPADDRLAGIEAVLAGKAAPPRATTAETQPAKPATPAPGGTRPPAASARPPAAVAEPAAKPPTRVAQPSPPPPRSPSPPPPRPLTGPDAVAPGLAAAVASLPTVPPPNAAPPPPVAAPEILPAAPPTVAPAPRARAARVREGRPLVVIDAGHGGKDPGAPSVIGGHEAQVTLAIARAAKQAIERDGRLRVRLTREDDRFLTLNQRVNLARRWGADLFVSVHADSAPNPQARGASVYTLSEIASDSQAARLAAKENNVDAIAGVSLRGQDRDVSGLLIDLAQRDSMNASADFAQLLQASASRRGVAFRSTFHRFAGFRVLKNVGVPAVLLEAGYMSNADDSRFLFSRDGQRAVAEGLAEAAAAFLLGDARPRVADRGATAASP